MIALTTDYGYLENTLELIGINMKSSDVFEQMVMQSSAEIAEAVLARLTLKINLTQYDQWQQQVVFDQLKGLRYGQSFCNYFGITDNILYFEHSWINADQYIRKTYFAKP